MHNKKKQTLVTNIYKNFWLILVYEKINVNSCIKTAEKKMFIYTSET